MFHTPPPFFAQEPLSEDIFDAADPDPDGTLKWLDEFLGTPDNDVPSFGAWQPLPPPPPPPDPPTRGIPAGSEALPLIGPLLDFSTAPRLSPIDRPGSTAAGSGEPATVDFDNMTLAQLKAWFVQNDGYIGLRYPDARREY